MARTKAAASKKAKEEPKPQVRPKPKVKATKKATPTKDDAVEAEEPYRTHSKLVLHHPSELRQSETDKEKTPAHIMLDTFIAMYFVFDPDASIPWKDVLNTFVWAWGGHEVAGVSLPLWPVTSGIFKGLRAEMVPGPGLANPNTCGTWLKRAHKLAQGE
eukprot:NODE_6339_length_635_cov_10.110922_g566_i2.p2 GENE.NODE_6339_length_635_cov_10.110922_g566_i2~~NODE_6339_length_635_cov_10.110922_g566_i2.p2  ORF type:complete len:159 (+),score=27.53 NODE_6339_length_635_cov_10.110922_g566_i2:71-547(+)